jgi:short-subunit dehydrogenase
MLPGPTLDGQAALPYRTIVVTPAYPDTTPMPRTSFKDRNILITGASSGIGAALAREFVGRGARPILVARRVERLDALAEELASASGAAPPVVIEADLTKQGACEHVVDEVVSACGTIDVLVNNAGVGYSKHFADLSEGEIHSMVQLNIVALTRLSHLVVPRMLERAASAGEPGGPRPDGRTPRGWIMNVASVVGYMPFTCMGVYAATKAYVVSLSASLAAQLRQQGIIVTCVAPGTTRTEFFDHRAWSGVREVLMKSAMSAERVARIGANALARGQRAVGCGLQNKLAICLGHHLPHRLSAWVTSKLESTTAQDARKKE